MNYFPNKSGLECFRSSLSNLFLELGDKKTANLVYSNLPKHKLSMPPENIFISTQFVQDLTKNKYSAILETGFPTFNIENSFKETVPKEKLSNFLATYNQQMFDGNIRFNDFFDIPGNSLALLQNPGQTFNHWVTIRDDFSVISDGQVRFDSNLEERVIGILQVYKNK